MLENINMVYLKEITENSKTKPQNGVAPTFMRNFAQLYVYMWQ